MTAAPGTPDGKRLDVLVTLVEAYERRRYPLDLPDPIEAIKFEREQKGLTLKGLVICITLHITDLPVLYPAKPPCCSEFPFGAIETQDAINRFPRQKDTYA